MMLGDRSESKPWMKHAQRFGGGGGGGGISLPGGGGGLPGLGANPVFPGLPFGGGALGGIDLSGRFGGGGKGGASWTPDRANPDFSQFDSMLPGVQNTLQANAAKFGDIASNNDPRYNNFFNAVQNLQNLQKAGALNSAQQQFSDRGMGNSSAAVNELNKIGTGYDLNSQQLAAQLGMNQIGRQDQAMLTQNDILGGALQNTLAKPSIQVGATAATNASGPSGGKGGK